jgi:predicted nucleic acid-binding protein
MIRAVVNSTPLISLSILGHMDLLKLLFDEVVVPVSVYEEVVVQGQGRPGVKDVIFAHWLVKQSPNEQNTLPPALLGLDRGELDVILLSKETKADWVLIDEKLGRKIAATLGLQVMGTLGILLAAYSAGFFSAKEADDALETLTANSIRISPRLMQWFKARIVTINKMLERT